MRFASLLGSILLVSAAAAAHAQLAVYGKFDLAHYSDRNANSSTFQTGGGVGVYNDFLRVGPVHLGLDVRGDFLHGNNLSYRSLMAGPRLALQVPILGLKPYVEATIGVGGARSTGSTAPGITTQYSNKLTYGGLGGLDFTVLPHLDWRTVEVAVNHQSDGSQTTTVVLVGTGLVVRF